MQSAGSPRVIIADAHERLVSSGLLPEFGVLLRTRKIQLGVLITSLAVLFLLLALWNMLFMTHQTAYILISIVLVGVLATVYVWTKATNRKLAALLDKAGIPRDPRFRL